MLLAIVILSSLIDASIGKTNGEVYLSKNFKPSASNSEKEKKCNPIMQKQSDAIVLQGNSTCCCLLYSSSIDEDEDEEDASRQVPNMISVRETFCCILLPVACANSSSKFANNIKFNVTVIDKICKNDTRLDNNDEIEMGKSKECDSIFTPLNYWGANMVVFANAIYIVPYVIVVVVYTLLPELRNRAYDGAVICYNISQIILNCILIGLGYAVLCRLNIRSSVYILCGLTIMYLTISSTFWLFVICFDMTLVITRFRWVPPCENNRSAEKRKFWTYAAWTLGAASVPTAFAAFVELSPLFPESSPIRPNFANFDAVPNYAVVVYVAILPALTCITNSALFAYTTYKMIAARQSTVIATANNATMKKEKKCYFVFLRLYLLMDAPWVTGALGAIFTDLWLLKFFRMLQPILMLLAILPRRVFVQIFTCKNRRLCPCTQSS